ncbi:MAG: COX15/CtaA family protein [Chitinophagaceae bacterium]
MLLVHTFVLMTANRNSPVAVWLLTGVAMIMIQVLLGGITRLTGSGLSITEWKPLLGAIPPMNDAEWAKAFEQYKQIGQFKHINFDFTLSDFKFIYFWEWFHRQWARLMGLVFAVGFLYFLFRRQFRKAMILPMILLFLLGGLQGAIGWIMVKSGLNDNDVHVNHIRLAIHFVTALALLVYVFWFALGFLIDDRKKMYAPALKYFTLTLLSLLTVQLFYGAFMAGIKAANFAPTWPDINGTLMPSALSFKNGHAYNDPITIQFIHRMMGYTIFLLTVLWWWMALRSYSTPLIRKTRNIPLLLVSMQVILGILSLVYSPDKHLLLWFGVMHQFVAMLLLLSFVWFVFLFRKKG